MKETSLAAISICVLAGGAIWLKASTTPGVAAVITSVTDGDTVRLTTENGRELKVRLACIDAPEGNVEGHGGAAAKRLEELTPVGSNIRFVELGSGGWGRRAGELYSGSWPFYTNANRKLVADGKAVVYPQYVSKCNRSDYWWDEKWARVFRRGVQGDSTFCNPWNSRRGFCPKADNRDFGFWWKSLWINPWKM